MYSYSTTAKKTSKGLSIGNSNLVILVFATAFFPRVLSGIGFPSAIDFIHFLTIPLACAFTLTKAQKRDRAQITIGKRLLFCIFILLSIIIASALLNNSGLINILLEFLLLSEPLFLFMTLICLPTSHISIQQFHRWLTRFSVINLVFAFSQYLVLAAGLGSSILGKILIGKPSNVLADNVKGVFVGQGAGHVVGASVSMSFAVYYYVTAKSSPLWLRISVIVAALIHIVLSDAKQVLLVFLIALFLFILTKLHSITEILRYLLISLGFVGLLILAANTIFPALTTWLDIEVLNEGIFGLKLSVFQIVSSYYTSSLNWFFGLGPGHTVGRLGGWIAREYKDLLEPFDLTTSPVSSAVWRAVAQTWLGSRSSLFSPLFTWAGIWGDLGLIGLGVYIYPWIFTWFKVCSDDLARFLLLTICVFGLIFTQMEEPGYMLFMMMLLGLQWHRARINKVLAGKSMY